MLDSKIAAEFLRICQVRDGDIAGTVCPWELNAGMEPREDYHDTQEAVYIWSLPENITDNIGHIQEALKYLRNRFDNFKNTKEPIKSYEASLMVFALDEYSRNSGDSSVMDLIDYSENYLRDFFVNQPGHNQRDYSNAYLKAALFGKYLKTKGADVEFLRKWLEMDLSLISPEEEINNEGPGYMFHHDFASTYGTKLFAAGVLGVSFDPKNFETAIPSGFVNRRFDENAFNSLVMIGLISMMPKLSGESREKAKTAILNIEKEIDSRIENGGLKRGGGYFNLRESWATFFYAYASHLLMESGIR